MEAGKRSISADELAQFSRIYNVDVRELLFVEFTEAGDEQRLTAKYVHPSLQNHHSHNQILTHSAYETIHQALHNSSCSQSNDPGSLPSEYLLFSS